MILAADDIRNFDFEDVVYDDDTADEGGVEKIETLKTEVAHGEEEYDTVY